MRAISNARDARELFKQLITLPDADLPLAEAALAIAWEDQGGGHPTAALQQLDQMVAELEPRLRGINDELQIIAALNGYLFTELGFRGNVVNYEDPLNSYLDHVLAGRVGIPITLSVVYLEVGWRLGLPVSGVGLPGHFLVRYTTADATEVFIDPFHRGRLWTRDECLHRIRSVHSHTTPAQIHALMQAPSRRMIIVRMLRNLKHNFVARSQFRPALASVERILLVEPDLSEELRDRGLLRSHLGDLHGALRDLERYVQRVPHAPDLPELRRYAAVMTEQLAYNN